MTSTRRTELDWLREELAANGWQVRVGYKAFVVERGGHRCFGATEFEALRAAQHRQFITDSARQGGVNNPSKETVA